MRGLQKAVGIKGNIPVLRFAGFLEKIAPNALKYIENTSSQVEVKMPNGATGIWVEEGCAIASKIVGFRGAVAGRVNKYLHGEEGRSG